MIVDVGVCLHQTTRSIKLIEMFLTLIWASVIDEGYGYQERRGECSSGKRDENNEVFTPSYLFCSQRPFTVDNTDMKINRLTGKRKLHSTAMAVFQQHIHGRTEPVIQIQRKS